MASNCAIDKKFTVLRYIMLEGGAHSDHAARVMSMVPQCGIALRKYANETADHWVRKTFHLLVVYMVVEGLALSGQS